MLDEKSHLPAVLQSLGCIAQTAMPVFETRESEVEEFIKKNILECSHVCLLKFSETCVIHYFFLSLKLFHLNHASLTDVRR